MRANICLEPTQPYYPAAGRRGIPAGRAWAYGARHTALRTALVLLIGVGLAVLFLGPQADAGPESVETVSHVVKAGETLWSIADAHTPAGDDVRQTVALIRSANGIASGLVRAGMAITIPVGNIPGWEGSPPS